jgi:hypothetical protein
MSRKNLAAFAFSNAYESSNDNEESHDNMVNERETNNKGEQPKLEIFTDEALLNAVLHHFRNFCEFEKLDALKKFEVGADPIDFLEKIYGKNNKEEMIRDGLYPGFLEEKTPQLYGALQRAARNAEDNPKNTITAYIPSYKEVRAYRRELLQNATNGHTEKLLSFVGSAVR